MAYSLSDVRWPKLRTRKRFGLKRTRHDRERKPKFDLTSRGRRRTPLVQIQQPWAVWHPEEETT